MRSNLMTAYGAPPGIPEGYELETLTTPYVHEDVSDAVDFAVEIQNLSDERGYVVQGIEPVQDPTTGLWGVYVEYWRPPVGAIRSGEVTQEPAEILRTPSNTTEKKGWPWYAYAGIGLGALAVLGGGYLIYKGSKKRR